MTSHFSIIAVLLLITFNCFSQTQTGPPREHPKRPFKLNTEILKEKRTVALPTSNATSPVKRTNFSTPLSPTKRSMDSAFLRNKPVYLKHKK